MKKIKTALSLVLVAAIILSISSISVLASWDIETEMIVASDMVKSKFGTDIGKKQVVRKVANDIAKLKDYIPIEDFCINRVLDNGEIEYVHKYTEKICDYLRIVSCDSNRLVISIEENDIYNTIEFCGNILKVDGYVIDLDSEISDGEMAINFSDGDIISPMSRTSMYSKKPYKGNASDYTLGGGLHYKHSAIDTKQTISSLAVTAIQIIITEALSLKRAYKLLFDTVSLALAANARENAPTSHYLSCKIWRYELANGSTALNRYYKYVGKYYVKSDYSGSYASGCYYENNYFS